MIRRVHVPRLSIGPIALVPAEAHHLRDVLRMEAGSPVELFDDSGNTAAGVIRHVNSANVVVDVETIHAQVSSIASVIVAAAIPKGDRADWMVEKLTELGVARFVPLIAQRSVVLPAGKNKIQRWERIAIESAKQSRRGGVMVISPMTPLQEVLESGQGFYLSTAADASPILRVMGSFNEVETTLLIGPEGGWTDGEIQQMNAHGFSAAALTATTLRVETAAVVAAAVVLCSTRFPPAISEP